MTSPEPSEPTASAQGDRRLDGLLRVAVTAATAVLLIGGACLGIAYLASAITELAAYGDARYYMKGYFLGWRGLHPNRGVSYPPLVYLWNEKLSLSLAGLHAFQALSLFAGLAYYTRRLAGWAGCERVARWPVCLTLAALGLLSSPLLLHHCLAVMPDALGTAWLLFVVVAVVEGFDVGERIRWNRRLALLLLAGLCAALIRNEHTYVFFAFALVTAALYVALATSKKVRLNVVLVCGGFLACIMTSMTVNGAIQRQYPRTRVTQFDMDDGPLILLVNRISYGALPSIHKHLDPKTKRRFNDPEELNEDSHQFPLKVKRLSTKQPAADVEAAARDVLSKAIELDWHNFSIRYYRDWVNQLVPSLSYPMSVPDGRPGKAEGDWTYSRTIEQSRSPRVVASWVAVSQALFWALVAGALLSMRLGTSRLSPRSLLGTVVIVFLCASFYATLTPSYNPRYTLPAAALGHMTLITLTASALLGRRDANVPAD